LSNNNQSISVHNFEHRRDQSFILYNGTVYTPWGKFHGGVTVRKGKIDAVFKGEPADMLAAKSEILVNCYEKSIVPGFIDLHVHGSKGFDFTLASTEEITRAVSFQAATGGTTALLPTIVSAPLNTIKRASEKIKQARIKISGPQILGVHLEGPFLNPRYKGAHSEEYLRHPEPKLIEDLAASLGEELSMITLSPELPYAIEAISYLSRQGIIVALGHSGATLEEVQKAVDCGLSHAVHTYSTMRRFHHRSPGALGAVLTMDEISAEIVADGVHIDPAAVKLFFRAKPPGQAILVTDALAVCGLTDGECMLGDKKIIKRAGKAFLENGTLAGSIITMNLAVAGAVKMSSLSLEKILPAATINPARVLGLDNCKGSLEKGKDADIVILDDDYRVISTICRGKVFRHS